MKYSHILAAASDELWAVCEPALRAILDFLTALASGVKSPAKEVQARISGA